MRVIGTAGHVDHGKSTLVAALTGTHPDRLKEEQAREMTIDLGFAWFTLPDGEDVGIVDVPGHRDFIENMLAGVGGIDAVLFVVAADEGVMPQTREHLAILDLLQIKTGIIVMTKVDMVDDPDWLDMVEVDIRTAVKGTVLEQAPILRVSAKSGAGLDELKKELADCLQGVDIRQDLGRPRLPVDRVFTMAGFGTVVTGTLVDGQLRIGDEVEFLPGGLRGRVRGLQSHKKKVDFAVPGSRTAVNVAGINIEDIQRGTVLVRPGVYAPTQRLDVYFRLLADASSSLKHSAEVKFFLGTAEVLARTRLLGTEELLPGQEGWLQLELRQPVLAVRGDRYILRRPSPGETLGGGEVVDPHPKDRHKRFSAPVLEQMEALRCGTPAEVLYQACLSGGIAPIREIVSKARLAEGQALEAIQELAASRQVFWLDNGALDIHGESLVAAMPLWESLTQRALQEIRQYHRTYPLRRGMPKEELKSRLKLSPKIFNACIRGWVNGGEIKERASLISDPAHVVKLTPQQQAQVDQLLAQFARSPFSPPSVKESQALVGEEVFTALIEAEKFVQVSAEVVYRAEDYHQLVKIVLDLFAEKPALTLAELRDRLNTSRKYVQAFLEHLDAIGMTVREGDSRRLKNSTATVDRLTR